MNNPLNFLFSVTVDREKLVKDVTRIAYENRKFTVDCWKYLIESDCPSWMKLIATEEIQKSRDSVNRFFNSFKDIVKV